MITVNRTLTPAERSDLENALAVSEKQKAITDYNVMMGNIEDPMPEEEMSNE